MKTVNEELLEKLSREDLIEVIANMHDTVQEWQYGWGYSERDGLVLEKVGRACAENMLSTGKWNHRKREDVFDKLANMLNIGE